MTLSAKTHGKALEARNADVAAEEGPDRRRQDADVVAKGSEERAFSRMTCGFSVPYKS